MPPGRAPVLFAACLALAACSQGVGAPVAARARDTASPSKGGSSHDASYVLTLERAPSPRLKIALTLASDGAAPVVVGCEDWGGVHGCEEGITDVKAFDAEERPLAVRRTERTWSVGPSPRGPVTITYVLASRPEAMQREESRFYPVVTDRYLHFVGHVGLLAPRDASAAAPKRAIDIHWRGFAEAGWTVASSFGLDRDLEIRRTFGELVHSVFVAGDYRILQSGDGVVLAARPGAWAFGAEDLLATALPVIAEERRLFDDDHAAPLLVVATPTASDEDAARGTMLSGSIDLAFPRPGRPLSAPLLGLLLAHEYFHRWDAQAMRPREAEGPGIMWFTEGFAEFYMRRVAYRAGRISRADYLWHLNQALAEYAANPNARAPNARVREEFRATAGMFRVPYLRGQLVALLVDAELRRASSGARSLDDLVRRLAADARSSGRDLTTDSVLAAVGAMTSREMEARVRDVVVNGAFVTLPPDALAPCFVPASSAGDVQRFELGSSPLSACAAVL